MIGRTPAGRLLIATLGLLTGAGAACRNGGAAQPEADAKTFLTNANDTLLRGVQRPGDAGELQRAWWELRERYQGVRPASARGEEFFDPGAKETLEMGASRPWPDALEA